MCAIIQVSTFKSRAFANPAAQFFPRQKADLLNKTIAQKLHGMLCRIVVVCETVYRYHKKRHAMYQDDVQMINTRFFALHMPRNDTAVVEPAKQASGERGRMSPTIQKKDKEK